MTEPAHGQSSDAGRTPDEGAEPPPILGSWRNVYLVLVLELVVITVLLFVISRWLS